MNYSAPSSSLLPKPHNTSVVISQSTVQLHEPSLSCTKIKPCRVCGARTSGSRLVCHACETCYYRNRSKSLGQCKKNGNCRITENDRKCTPCRFEKCCKVGIGREQYMQNSSFSSSDRMPFLPSSSFELSEPIIAEKCAVCDGESIGIHFGVPCCESCRTFFTRHKKKDSVGYCSRGGNCKIIEQQCTPCRFRKSLKAGMEKKNETELLKILPGHAIVMKILAAHNEICEYTREKMKKLVMSDYPWTPDKNTHLMTNRVFAWKAYSIQFERDIKSAIKFIKHLQDNLAWNDREQLIKKHLFQMHVVQITRALSRSGLLFPDGRLISLDFLNVLFGEQLAEEMIKFSEQALNSFKLDDDDLAMLLVMSFYPRIPGNELTIHEIGDEDALMKLSRESRCNFSQWCEDRKVPGTFIHILIMLKKLEQLDNMYKTAVIGFLKSNAKHFDPKPIFAEIYLM